MWRMSLSWIRFSLLQPVEEANVGDILHSGLISMSRIKEKLVWALVFLAPTLGPVLTHFEIRSTIQPQYADIFA